ncbi:MAG: hypothetical protein HQM08_19995 [Candidatus Riflebacteria bacterium]|nr:hypothetical protein [Candidatus Riflebacteria bacterium]
MSFENGSGTNSLHIGPKICKAEKVASGGVQITLPNEKVLTVNLPSDGSKTGELVADGITWKFTWGDSPLLTLENTQNGHTLTVTESDTGALTITPIGGLPHQAKWDSSGNIVGQFPSDGSRFTFSDGLFSS